MTIKEIVPFLDTTIAVATATVAIVLVMRDKRSQDEKTAYDEKSVKMMIELVNRWKSEDGEFRQFATHRLEAVKVLSAAHATVLLAITAFITTVSRSMLALAVAKFCFILICFAVVQGGAAYWHLYHWGIDIEHALFAARGADKVDDERIDKSVRRAADRSESAGYVISRSIKLLALASGVAAIGIIFGLN